MPYAICHVPPHTDDLHHAIACDRTVGDEVRLSAAELLAGVDPSAAAPACLAIAGDGAEKSDTSGFLPRRPRLLCYCTVKTSGPKVVDRPPESTAITVTQCVPVASDAAG